MVIKTIRIKIEPDETNSLSIEKRAKESSLWMNKVFHLLYVDKRNHKWSEYGPTKDWGQSYGSIVGKKIKCVFLTSGIAINREGKIDKSTGIIKDQGIFLSSSVAVDVNGELVLATSAPDPTFVASGSWQIDGRAFYPAFIGNKKIKSIFKFKQADLQLLSQKVAVVWGNFIGDSKKVPRPKAIRGQRAEPRMGKVAIYHIDSKKMTFNGNSFIIKTKDLTVNSTSSTKLKFIKLLNLIKANITKKGWSAIEIRKHDDNNWYAHIPVSIESPKPMKQPIKIMGIDVGIINNMTVSVVNSKTSLPIESKRISGMRVAHKLDRIYARTRILQSKAKKGNKSAARKLKELKGIRPKIQDALVRQSTASVMKLAHKLGVDGISIEDLTKMKKPSYSKRMNRRLTNWAKGKARNWLEFKCTENGLGFKEVPAAWTSLTCPVCGNKDRENRKSQSSFVCTKCGYIRNADDVGSINIARRGYAYWHSPKWDLHSTSSQPVEGCGREGNNPENSGVIGEARNPLTQTDGGVPSPETVLQPKKSDVPDVLESSSPTTTSQVMTKRIRSEVKAIPQTFPTKNKKNINHKKREGRWRGAPPEALASNSTDRIRIVMPLSLDENDIKNTDPLENKEKSLSETKGFPSEKVE
jgi:IS605 OrfB family transposase